MRLPTNICRSIPSAGWSTGMLDQFKCRAMLKLFPFPLSEEAWDISSPLLFVTNSFQTRSTRSVFGLHVHDSVKAIFTFPYRRHHPQEIYLPARRRHVRVISLRHQHAITLAHDLDQLGSLRIRVNELHSKRRRWHVDKKIGLLE